VGVYSFEPLPTGFGYTLANALRRVLLSSIGGAAATQVKIKRCSSSIHYITGSKRRHS